MGRLCSILRSKTRNLSLMCSIFLGWCHALHCADHPSKNNERVDSRHAIHAVHVPTGHYWGKACWPGIPSTGLLRHSTPYPSLIFCNLAAQRPAFVILFIYLETRILFYMELGDLIVSRKIYSQSTTITFNFDKKCYIARSPRISRRLRGLWKWVLWVGKVLAPSF